MATQPPIAETNDKQSAASRPDAFLSFEVEGELLHIIANPEGIARLKRIVERLAQAASQGVNEDAHLFAESWGGYDLNETSLIPTAITMKQVDFRVRLNDPRPSDAA
jgi:hypothetical protein